MKILSIKEMILSNGLEYYRSEFCLPLASYDEIWMEIQIRLERSGLGVRDNGEVFLK